MQSNESGDCGAAQVFSARVFGELTLDDVELQGVMLASFLNHLPGMRQDLLASVWQGPQAFRDAVHRLKGSCQCVAALRVQAVLMDAEAAALGMAPAQRHAVAARVEQELDTLVATIEPLLRGLQQRAA